MLFSLTHNHLIVTLRLTRCEWCMNGPIIIGLELDAGIDTVIEFTLSEIEADPAGYYADIHTIDWVLDVNGG